MSLSKSKIRVLLAKSVLEQHDRGVRYVATKFRDAGMEVIYLHYRLIEEVAKTAVEEDVDAIGLSSSCLGYMADIERLKELLKRSERTDIPLIVGGIIAERDIPKLFGMGVSGIFGPGSHAEDAIKLIDEQVVKAA